MKRSAVWIACTSSLLIGCASDKTDPAPTLKSLEGRAVPIEGDASIDARRTQAIAGYRAFLGGSAPDPMRAEAMRRLGDLEMEHADAAQLEPSSQPARQPRTGADAEYRNAIRAYQDLLRAYPDAPTRDHVLYQLAKAHELAGELNESLRVLDRLVAAHPHSAYIDEAHFRRGEMLFTLKSYEPAEQAYRQLITRGAVSPFYERALYMHGWSHFKQLQYEPALDSFIAVLDRRLRGQSLGDTLSDTASLSRADRELVEDTFRVMSLSVSNLKGPETLAALFGRIGKRDYEYIAYQQLGELYTRQERIKDTADAYQAFVRRYPDHPQAPLMQVQVIEAYKRGNFAGPLLEAKKEFVTRYAAVRALPPHVAGHVRTHLNELARHYHAQAQKDKRPEDYREAARWYGMYLDLYPADPQAPNVNFLYAEMLFENNQHAQAAGEYEKTAYRYVRHTKAADAGYSALLAYAEQEKRAAPAARAGVRARAIESALRFADTFPADSRATAVLADAAEKLYNQPDRNRATTVARKLLVTAPAGAAGPRRSAWTIIAHSEFESGAYARAEEGYREALTLTPPAHAGRDALVERLATAVYKQGEHSRARGDVHAAVAHFQRVREVAPSSPVRIVADYDAAAALLSVKDWNAAARSLEQFRRAYPNHPLQAEIAPKLAAVYLESGRWADAAGEFDRLADPKGDPKTQRDAVWQAAELYQKAGAEARAAGTYERYLRLPGAPLAQTIEARHRLAGLAQKRGDGTQYQTWLAELVKVEANAGAQRTDRTRALAAAAAMALAEPHYSAYQNARLVEPLKKNLKVKKEKMQQALKAYTHAADYGVAEVATAATYRIADIYHELSRALMASQRPKGLKGDALEQYNVMLEEQAFPFEEKAIEIHEVNAQRVGHGVYDEWVKKSFVALGRLRPVRYAKSEKGEAVIDAIR